MLRVVLLVLGGLFAVVAVGFTLAGCVGPAFGFGFWALLLLGGVAVERWRYKPLADGMPGPDWQATDERFLDPETGKMVTVYFHPRTGERRYVAA